MFECAVPSWTELDPRVGPLLRVSSPEFPEFPSLPMVFECAGLRPYAETQELGTGNCSQILALQIWFLIAE